MRACEGEEYRGGAAADKIEIDSSDQCVQRYVDWLADRREGEGGRKRGGVSGVKRSKEKKREGRGKVRVPERRAFYAATEETRM